MMVQIALSLIGALVAYTFVQLEENEFDAFVDSQHNGSFLQSPAMGKRRSLLGWSAEYVGAKDEAGNIRAAALLNSRIVFKGYSDVECLQGPVLNYDNTELFTFFFTELKGYLRSQRALSFWFDPKLLLNHRDLDAQVIDDGYDGGTYVSALQRLGFTHQSNAEIDANPLYLRWYFAKDLSGISTVDELLKSFDAQATRSVKKNIKKNIQVNTLSLDNLDEFFAIMRETGERRGFDYRDEEYYQSLGKYFGPERIAFRVAQLDVQQYAQAVRSALEKDTAALAKAQTEAEANPENKKAANKLAAAQQAVTAGQSREAELAQLEADGPLATLAAAVFIEYAQEVVFLAGGSFERYSNFYAAYALHFESMQQAIKHGISRYNFYGTKGDFAGTPEQEGVYRFKRGFGGAVEEQIGYFSYSPHPMIESARKLAGKLRRRR